MDLCPLCITSLLSSINYTKRDCLPASNPFSFSADFSIVCQLSAPYVLHQHGFSIARQLSVPYVLHSFRYKQMTNHSIDSVVCSLSYLLILLYLSLKICQQIPHFWTFCKHFATTSTSIGPPPCMLILQQNIQIVSTPTQSQSADPHDPP